MRKYNQYTQDILDYNREHGTDIFLEYKQEDTTEERKKEIEDFLYNLISERGEVPKVIWNDIEIQSSMIRLSNVRAEDIYKEGVFGFNSCGTDVLYHFFPEIDEVRKPTCPESVVDFLHRESRLRRVLRKSLQYADSELGIYRMFLWCGAGYCVNFRPTTAKSLYEIYGGKDCKVFDSSAGYGARLLGAHFANNVVEYVGIDPNTKDSCDKLIEYISRNFNTGTKEKVYKMGSEDFTEEDFPEYQNYFDLYFTSPPYFNTEKYSDDETQSYKKFPTYMGWIKGFYQETIHNACNALKQGGVFSINIFEKVPKIKEITKAFLADNGWYVVKNDKYLLRTMPGAITVDGERVRRDTSVGTNFEPIWVAYHYSRLYEEGLISKDKAIQYRNRAIRDNKKIEI